MADEPILDELQEEEELPLLQFTYPDEDGEFVPLSQESHDGLVQKIARDFDRLDTDRNSKIELWQDCERIVKGIASKLKGDRFYALVPFGKQTVQTLVSHFWGRSLQTPKLFFSVDGLDEPSKEMAPIHRQNLMLHMEKDRVRQKMDKGVYLHALMKGVLFAQVSIKSQTQELSGPKGLVGNWAGQGFGQQERDEAGNLMWDDITRTVFEGATMTIIDPYDFVFDTENHENWDNCFKACRKWLVYEDIADDPNFSNYEELKELCKQGKPAGNEFSQKRQKKKEEKNRAGIDSHGRIEVIEVHGDVRLKGGRLLRNWTVVIAARKKIIRFEQNPMRINPFVRWEYEPSEDGWSIPPIAYILGLVDAGSILLSSGVEAAKMALNPPMLSPEGAIQQKKHFITEGLILNWKPSPNAPNQAPTPIQFNYEAPFPYLQQFEGQSEAVTSATRQMSGNVTKNDKVQTATEFQGLQVVGNLVLDRLVDLFNLDFKIPVIEKISLINAIANPEEKTIPFENDKGVREFKPVTPEVYFGNYEYLIEDNKSEIERKQNIKEQLDFLTMFNEDPVVGPRIKKLELFPEFLRNFGYGNPAKYIMNDDEFVMFSANQNAIIQEIQIMTELRLQQRLQAEGLTPNVESIATGLLAGASEAQDSPGEPGMEGVPQLPG